jgi:hypothetical protein
MTIQFITLFRGDDKTTNKWIESFNKAVLPEGCSLVAVIPDGYVFPFNKVRTDVLLTLNEEERLTASTHPDGPEYDKPWNQAKSAFVARLNSKYSETSDKEITAFWNDDVILNDANGIDLILSHFSNPEVVNSIGLYPHRDMSYMSVVKHKFSKLQARMEVMQHRSSQVFCGSPGFSFWRTDYLKTILPIVDWEKRMDTSHHGGIMMERDKKICICEGNVILSHS